MALSTAIQRVQSMRAERLRLADTGFLREAAFQNVGSVTANRMGLQLARIVGREIAWHARPAMDEPAVRAHLDTLERDGVVVLHDFLPPEAFREISDEFTRSRSQANVEKYRTVPQGENWILEEMRVSAYRDEYPAFHKYFEANETIHKIVAGVMRRPVNYPSVVWINIRRRLDADRPHVDSSAAVLHTDRHYRTVKAFYYLTDVDENNAAYVYAKGSHRLTLARLKHEYDFSVRYAQLARGEGHLIPSQLLDRGLNKVRDEHLRAMGIVETPIRGKANTLIISNNMGFHRRGDSQGKDPRITVNLDFNHLESPARMLFPLIRRLPF